MGRKALVLVGAVLAAACGPGSDPAEVAETLPADVTTKTSIVGGSPKQQKLLRAILVGLGPTPIETIEIDDQPEKDWGAAPDAVGLKAGTSRPSILASWHAKLVAKAFQEGSHELGLPPIAYVSDGENSGSSLVDQLGRAGREAMTLEETQELVEALHKAASTSGAKARLIAVLRPRRPAFVVELEVDDAAAFLRDDRAETALAPLFRRAEPYAGYDGHYLKIVDGEGRHVLEFGWYPFGGTGSIRPDLEGCAPGLSSSLISPPPPCPAK